MKAFIRGAAIFSIGAALGFLAVILLLPSFVMGGLMGRLQATGSAAQFAPPLPDEKSRSVVLPSPDLAYVLCVYDLAKGPLMVTFHPPDLPYWSIAAYAANTDNFVVINDRNAGEIRDLVLISPDQPVPPTPPDTRVVQAPNKRGVVLFRGLLQNRDENLLKQVQASISCHKADKP